eukprot:351655-Chlamydomonas_euryale.AAC.1
MEHCTICRSCSSATVRFLQSCNSAGYESYVEQGYCIRALSCKQAYSSNTHDSNAERECKTKG